MEHDGYTALGVWIRNCRHSKGIRSAAALSRKAGLGLNHVATFERGLFRPRWETVLKLADALELAPDEREEFFRVWAIAGQPDDVREAMALPGTVLWKHAQDIMQINHRLARPFWIDPDQVTFDIIRAFGALLAWVALADKPLSGAGRDRLQKAIDDEWNRLAHPPADQQHYAITPEFKARSDFARSSFLMALPTLWRQHRFAQPKTARRYIQAVAEWRYQPGWLPELQRLMSIQFKPSSRFAVWSVPYHVDVESVIHVHEAMVAYTLWEDLALAERLGGPIRDCPFQDTCAILKRALPDFMDLNLEGLARQFNRKPRPPGTLTNKVETFHLLGQVEMARRFIESPVLWPKLAPPGMPHSPEAVLRKLDELRGMLENLPPLRSRTPPP